MPLPGEEGKLLKRLKVRVFPQTQPLSTTSSSQAIRESAFFRTTANIKSLLEHVELGLQRFNVAGTGFQQTPISTDLNHYPLMAMPPNRQQLRPLVSNPLIAMPPNRQQLRPLMSHPLAPLHFA